MFAAQTCSAASLAKLFDLTERRIQQLAKDGVIPESEKGKYDLVASVQGYIKYLQARSLGRMPGTYADTPLSDIHTERKRLLRAQADKLECDYQLKRGQLVSLAAVIETLNEAAIIYGSSLDALPGRLAQELAGIFDPTLIKRKLFDECRHIRNLTAEHLCRFAQAASGDGSISEPGSSAESQNTG